MAIAVFWPVLTPYRKRDSSIHKQTCKTRINRTGSSAFEARTMWQCPSPVYYLSWNCNRWLLGWFSVWAWDESIEMTVVSFCYEADVGWWSLELFIWFLSSVMNAQVAKSYRLKPIDTDSSSVCMVRFQLPMSRATRLVNKRSGCIFHPAATIVNFNVESLGWLYIHFIG